MQTRTIGNVFAVLMTLAMVLCLTGCQKTKTVSEPTTANLTTTAAPEVVKKGTATVIRHMTVKNGNYEYTYDFDYDFSEKQVSIIAKGVPAGDQVLNEAYTWYLCRSVLSGLDLEALPDSSGANEELLLRAQPLLVTGDILHYKTTIYEEDSKSPSSVLTYDFRKNAKGQVSDATIRFDFAGSDEYDYDAIVKYRYDDNGFLRKVTETSETRDLIWEFSRDERNVLTNETLETITKDGEAIDHWLSLTEYVYDSDGLLIATKTKADGSQLGEWTTRYLFSETTGKLSLVTDEFTRTSFGYDDTLDNLVLVKNADKDSGEEYWRIEYTYADVELP